MKKTTLFTFFLMLTGILSAQAPVRQLDKQNMREGESVEYCHTHKRMVELLKDPAMMAIYEQEQQNELLNKGKDIAPKATVYKIPVVFHVLHNGGVENISDEQIFDAMEVINRDYRRLNADADNVHADFQGMPADIEIEFVLATKAPNGTCFKGITRTLSAMSYNGDNGTAQVNAIVSGNDVYNGQWPGNKYMNVFVCGDIGGAAGYTTKPAFGGTGMTNGIWVLHNYVGRIGTSSEYTSRTLTHEAGHWLNLDHTWGGNNNPGNTSSCGTDDNVQDTPNCIGVQSCAMNSNTCNSDNAYWGFDIRDNVENYMDYSYCSKMFTDGQRTRMRNAIVSSSGGRNNLWTTTNLQQTGADGNLYLCKADFFADRTTICVGDVVNFNDDSYNVVTGWNWTFDGGSPAASSDQNPSVTYNTPGYYAVNLTSTDGTTSDSEVKTAYIRVLPASATIPFLEGFESYTSLTSQDNWEIENFNNNNAFTLESNFGHTGTKCVKLVNYGQAAGSSDELISSPVDLSSITSAVTLSFRYAYRKKTSSDVEWLKVYVTGDCGDTWIQRKTLSGNSLSSLTSTTSWSPASSSDWVTVHMTNVTSTYWVDNFRYKFRFESDGGNNFYLDNINIYPGSPSDNLVVGIAEEGEFADLALYPNPADAEVNLRFTVNNAQQMVIAVKDITGKHVKDLLVNAAAGTNLVMMDTNELSSGSYFMTISNGEIAQTMKFVIQ
ncbi:MAG: T9SS type A sorting domain-containing protein [Bacteroidetes bacterium]|nr:MAG: T9SS type A sorting domain-containing protein [Bacteroidota bacterium]